MPGYEMGLVMRAMKKPELISAVKRTLTFVLDNRGVIRKIESLGEKTLPYRMRVHQENFTQGHYFVVEFVAAPSILALLKDHQRRDIDVIRQGIIRQEELVVPPCEGPYSELYAGAAETINKRLLKPKKKKGAVKWPNTDKLD